MTLAVVLLAAGHGTRMNSRRQKVLHEVGGKPMLLHPFEAAEALADLKPVLVVGPGGDEVQALLGDRAAYVLQQERLGTGHATMMARDALQGRASQVLVAYGDMPLLQQETMAALARKQAATGAALALLIVPGDEDSSFGRVLRDEQGRVTEIVEVAQAQQRPDGTKLLALREHNAGVYCFDGPWLWQHIAQLPLRQARSGPEYYLTDMVELAVRQGRAVEAVVAADGDEGLGAGTRAELVAVERALRRRVNERWMAQGVTLVDPDTIYIDPGVHIGMDTVIWPNSYLQGATEVGEACVVGPNTILRDAHLGHGCHVEQAVLHGATVQAGTTVRPGSVLLADAAN